LRRPEEAAGVEKEAAAPRPRGAAERSAAASEDFAASWFVEPTGVTELKRPARPERAQPQVRAAESAVPSPAAEALTGGSVLSPGGRPAVTTARRVEAPRSSGGRWFLFLL